MNILHHRWSCIISKTCSPSILPSFIFLAPLTSPYKPTASPLSRLLLFPALLLPLIVMELTSSPSSSPVVDTLLPPLAGGALIGLSALYGFVLHGRVTGVSGELHAVATLQSLPSLHFLSGLSLAGLLFSTVPGGPAHLLTGGARSLEALHSTRLAGGAFLVGLGAGLGNGCTSGHGVCGLARLSKRSIIAVLSFMGSGMITASLLRSASIIPPPPLLSSSSTTGNQSSVSAALTNIIPNAAFIIPFLSTLPYILAKLPLHNNSNNARRATLLSSVVNGLTHMSRGALFATGLILSGMTHPWNTVRFMDVVTPGWTPALALVFAGALPVAFAGFRAAYGQKKPLLAERPSWPTRSDVDGQLVAGAVLFGVGWALVGVCPAPMVTVLGAAPRATAVQTVMGMMTVGVVVGKRAGTWIGALRRRFGWV